MFVDWRNERKSTVDNFLKDETLIADLNSFQMLKKQIKVKRVSLFTDYEW